MKVDTRKLPVSERYACSIRHVKALLADHIERARPTKTYAFDTRCFDQPALVGPIVAAVAVTRQRQASLRLFAVSRDQFDEADADRFATEVLPRLRQWLEEQKQKPDTGITGVEECIIEKISQVYRFHTLQYL